MTFLYTIPAFVRILIVFALILVGIHRKVLLGHCFCAGAIFLGILFGMGPVAILKSSALALSHPKTLCLAAVVSLILVLSLSLEVTGQMQRLLDNFQGLIRLQAINFVIFPALIGLLPMPGGAIFSAPMVKNIGKDGQLNAAELSYINIWFRHVWEYCWPLYPGVLLVAALGELSLWSLVLAGLPMTLVAVVSGYWPLRDKGFIFGPTPQNAECETHPSPWPFFKELAPVWTVVVLGIAIGTGLDRFDLFGNVAKETGLIIALILAILMTWQTNGLPMATRRKILADRKLGDMVYMVGSILIFKGILEDSQAVAGVSSELLRLGIPLTIVVVTLPLLVGLVSGITIAFVGTTFPILISLIHASPASPVLLPYLILGLVTGFIGVLISPLHVCLLLSNQYFETSMDQVYRHMALPCLAMLLAAFLYFQVLVRL